jgi:hypothetical protein
MLSLKSTQITAVPLLALFVGGSLYLSSQHSLAQTTLPQVEPGEEFYQNNPNYQAAQTRQNRQNGQNLARYVVYIESDNFQILQRVRQIDSTAYIRNLNGRNVIQSGVFSESFNAQKRVQELQLNGINSGRIITYYHPEKIREGNNNFDNPNRVVNPEQVKYYYVIIPTSREKLNFLRQEIQRKIEGNTNVFTRTQPRGAHIAVGGFRERQEAEQWNNYLRNLGYGNARVYYGK